MINKFFNLIEVTLAIAVVGIGIAGIMSLFPVALNSSRDSVANNYSSLIADQFITYLTMKANTLTWLPSINANPGIPEIPTAKPTTDDSSVSWTPVATGSNISSGSLGSDKIYKITQGSAAVIDFSAVVRIWQGPVNDMHILGWTGALERDFANRIFVEVSWPLTATYDKRLKRCYMVELFNYQKQSGL